MFKQKKPRYIKISVSNLIIYLLIILSLVIFSVNHLVKKDSPNLIKFEMLVNLIEKNYQGDITREELYQNAIKGIFNNLDDYSYVKITDLEKYKHNTQTSTNYINKSDQSILPQKEYIGIGITVSESTQGLLISDIYKDSDLYNFANVNDIITEINNIPFDDNFQDFQIHLSGKEGEEKNVKIKSKDEIKKINIKVKKINKENVTAEIIDNDIAYFKIKIFSNEISKDFKLAFDELENKQKNIKGIIIDLADNSGGFFIEGIELANIMIDSNKLAASTAYKNPKNSSYYHLQEGDYFKDTPITIIVNKNSASATELFAAIFKDFNRGKIIGQNTYGKGVGQNVIDFNSNISYSLTTFEFFIGENNIKINKIGVAPDILIENDYSSNKEYYINEAIKSIKG